MNNTVCGFDKILWRTEQGTLCCPRNRSESRGGGMVSQRVSCLTEPSNLIAKQSKTNF